MRDVKTDALIVDPNKCIGCRMCFNSCPIGGMSVEQNKGTAMKCDLCDGQPRCVEFCPTGALKYSRLDKISVLKKREEIGKYFETLKSVAHLLTEERGDGK
jgi:Fe-S-cluster-containing hydrogenase component 2